MLLLLGTQQIPAAFLGETVVVEDGAREVGQQNLSVLRRNRGKSVDAWQ